MSRTHEPARLPDVAQYYQWSGRFPHRGACPRRTLAAVSSALPTADAEGIARVIEAARPVAELLAAEGHRSYVVGGLVRDLLLGVPTSSADVDMTTDALPGDVKRIVAPIADDLWAVGERFGTIGCRVDGVEFEITTHRAERYEPGSRKPVVEFSTAIDADLSRRDFTVNAMAISLPDGEVVDPFDGAGDLRERRLRTPDDPVRSFDDDPLRVLRAARFRAAHDLEPVPELVAGAQEVVARLEIVSAERKRVELDKLLATARPSIGLRLLDDIGVWPWVLPHLEWLELEQVGAAVDAVSTDAAVVVADHVVPTDATVLVRRSVLLGGLGGSRRVDADTVDEAMQSLRHSKADRQRTRRVVECVHRVVEHGVGAPSVRRVVAALRADTPVLGMALDVVDTALAAEWATALAALAEVEPLDHFGPGLDGREIMQLLGVDTGRAVGDANELLVAIRLDEGVLPLEELRDRLRSWWATRDV